MSIEQILLTQNASECYVISKKQDEQMYGSFFLIYVDPEVNKFLSVMEHMS